MDWIRLDFNRRALEKYTLSRQSAIKVTLNLFCWATETIEMSGYPLNSNCMAAWLNMLGKKRTREGEWKSGFPLCLRESKRTQSKTPAFTVFWILNIFLWDEGGTWPNVSLNCALLPFILVHTYRLFSSGFDICSGKSWIGREKKHPGLRMWLYSRGMSASVCCSIQITLIIVQR